MRSPACVAAIVATVVCASCTAGAKRPALAPAVTPDGIRFSLMNADARSVTLAGSFNQWSATSDPMMRQGTSALWTRVVPLSPGEHAFMFVIDGTQWITPPFADDFVDDGFGAKNGVVLVRPTER